MLKREIPARIHCTHNDMAAAIQCLSKYNLRFTIEHAWGSSNYLDEIVAQRMRDRIRPHRRTQVFL